MSEPRGRGRPDRGYGPVRDLGGMRKSGPYQRDGLDKKEKERPSRTLFIRNIDYSISGDELQKLCETFGQMKKFFPLIEKRGMAFVTYYDSRDAERARKDLQDRKFNGRPIDVHFALPKDADAEQDENTGTLFVTVRNASSPPENHEIRTYFEQWGQIREVRDCKNSAFQKFVEYYDLRDSEKAYTEAQDKPFQDGYFDIRYAFLQGAKDKKSESRQDRSPPRTQNPPPMNPLPMSSMPPLQSFYPNPNLPMMGATDLSSLTSPYAAAMLQQYYSQLGGAAPLGSAPSLGAPSMGGSLAPQLGNLPNVPLQAPSYGSQSYQQPSTSGQYVAPSLGTGGTSANTAQLQQLMSLLLQQQQPTQQQQYHS